MRADKHCEDEQSHVSGNVAEVGIMAGTMHFVGLLCMRTGWWAVVFRNCEQHIKVVRTVWINVDLHTHLYRHPVIFVIGYKQCM